MVATTIIAGLLAGCGSSSDKAERSTLASLEIPPPPPPVGSNTPGCANEVSAQNATASLRPPAVMPSPGHMPAGSFMAKIAQHGRLIAGVDQNTWLLSYVDPLTGKFKGFEIALLHQLAEAIFGNPNRVTFKAVTNDERVQALKSGSVDIVADAYTITPKRRCTVDFTTVYYDAGQKLLVPATSGVSSIKELGGKPVCATANSTSLDTLKKQVPRPIPIAGPQRTDCLVYLQQGLVQAVTGDDPILLGYKAQDPNTKIVGSSFADDPYGMAISKQHPDFVRFVNGVLEKMRRDGVWRALYKQYFGPYLTGPIPQPPKAKYDG
jgi:polar amino acid transport system substrate-binding protein